MNRPTFTANAMRSSAVPFGTKCFVCLLAMNKKLSDVDMDLKFTYGRGFSNNGIVKGYNALKDEYKVYMYELTNGLGHKTIWVDAADLDFAL